MEETNIDVTAPKPEALTITSKSTGEFINLLAKGPTDEDATRKQEGRRRLDSLIEERDKNRDRFLAAVEILHTKETKHELITTFGIAQRLTAEIHELADELRSNPIGVGAVVNLAVNYDDIQNMAIESSYREMRANETRRLINELKKISEGTNPPE